MNLTGLSIADMAGVERLLLDGDYTAEALAEKLIEEWIPYFECHKCGRWSYCKYAQRHPANPARSVDIKCGIAIDCLRNLCESAYPILEKMNQEQLQSFLDGAFHYFGFVYSAEQWIGMNMEKGFHEYFKDYSAFVYSRVSHVRVHLDKLAYHWKDLPDFKTKSSILIVEGYSEKAFFDELRKSHSSWFLDLEVQVYGGKGNRKSKRIQMLLERYKEQGLVIHAQGDADGNSTDIFRNLIDIGLIESAHTFVFAHDFETAVPPKLSHTALTSLEAIPEMPAVDFCAALDAQEGNFSARLKSAFGVDIGPLKIDFAVEVANILNHSIWWNKDEFMENTELGRFLRFVQKI
jgi:hypothetical protein